MIGERITVGSLTIRHDGGEAPVASFDDGWRGEILAQQSACEIFRDGMSDEWALDFAVKMMTAGEVVLYFFVTKLVNPDRLSILSVAPGCRPMTESFTLFYALAAEEGVAENATRESS